MFKRVYTFRCATSFSVAAAGAAALTAFVLPSPYAVVISLPPSSIFEKCLWCRKFCSSVAQIERSEAQKKERRIEEEQVAENDKEEEQAGAETEAEAGKACNFALLLCVAYFCAALFPRCCNFVCAHLKFINVCVCVSVHVCGIH